MALNFPNPATQTPVNTWSPTSTPSASTNGLTYTWDGDKWSTSGGADLHVLKTGDTMTGDLTLPNLVATGDVQSTSQNGGQLAGFRNLLINSDYGIAQRYSNYPWTATGVISNTKPESLFGPDRWCTPQFREFQSRGERPSNLFAGSIQWRLGTSSNATWNQVIELLGDSGSGPRLNPLLDSKDWTVSHWIFTADRSNFACSIEYVNASYSPSISSPIASIADGDWTVVETQGDWTRVAASFSMTGVAAAPTGALGIRVQFSNDANIRAVGAQLEPGPVATPFEHRLNELALCQRYYERSTAGGGGTPMVGDGSNGTNQQALVPFKVTKRAAPTLTLNNTQLKVDGTVQSMAGVTGGPTGQIDGFLVYLIGIPTATYTGSVQLRYNFYEADAEL